MFNAYSEMSIMVGGLAGFYKQRDSFFYPAWAASLPTALLRLPYSFVESLVLSCIIYWVSGLAPEPARYIQTFLNHSLLLDALAMGKNSIYSKPSSRRADLCPHCAPPREQQSDLEVRSVLPAWLAERGFWGFAGSSPSGASCSWCTRWVWACSG